MSFLGGTTVFASNERDNTYIQQNYAEDLFKRNTYENWLKETQDSQVINEFSNLNEQEKVQFIDILSDEKTVIDLFHTDIPMNESRNFKNGNIQISVKLKEENISSTRANQNRRATFTRTLTVFGVRVLESVSWVEYTHDGKRIISVDHHNHFLSRMLFPLTGYKFSGERMSKTETKAFSDTDLQFTFLHGGLNLVTSSGRIQVWGDVNNNAGGSVAGY